MPLRMTPERSDNIVADPNDDLSHLNVSHNSEPIPPYQDSTLIGIYNTESYIAVSRQDLKIGCVAFGSPDQGLPPAQKRHVATAYDPQINKKKWEPYDVPQTRYWVDTPRHHFVFSTRTQALCWASIMHQTGLREVESHNDLVPVEIASLGQAYIAAYLHAIPECDDSEIAERMGLSESTVNQYYSDVAGLRR